MIFPGISFCSRVDFDCIPYFDEERYADFEAVFERRLLGYVWGRPDAVAIRRHVRN